MLYVFGREDLRRPGAAGIEGKVVEVEQRDLGKSGRLALASAVGARIISKFDAIECVASWPFE